jgi:hypothetical protein
MILTTDAQTLAELKELLLQDARQSCPFCRAGIPVALLSFGRLEELVTSTQVGEWCVRHFDQVRSRLSRVARGVATWPASSDETATAEDVPSDGAQAS